MIIDTSDISS